MIPFPVTLTVTDITGSSVLQSIKRGTRAWSISSCNSSAAKKRRWKSIFGHTAAKYQLPGKELFLGETCTKCSFLLCFSGPPCLVVFLSRRKGMLGSSIAATVEGGREWAGKRHMDSCTYTPKSPQAPSGQDNLLQMEQLCKHMIWQASLGTWGFDLDKTHVLLMGEKLRTRYTWVTWSVSTEKLWWLLRVTIFQACNSRELNLVEIKSSWLTFLTNIFFTHLLCTEPILESPQGSKNSNTMHLLRGKTNLKMVNLKISSNPTNCKFSNNETAHKVIE